jgi:hypothetical protein
MPNTLSVISPLDIPLSRAELKRAIDGKGAPRRVPLGIHLWAGAWAFGDRAGEYQAVLDRYPCDFQYIYLNMPGGFDAPADDPSYRWLNFERPNQDGKSIDESGGIDTWDRLDGMLAHFPDPRYPGLITKDAPPDTGLYRMGFWWYSYFERLWSLRGMENSLCDLYENGDSIHRLFRALTDFYKAAMTRGRNELGLDAIMTSDDIGMQTGPFFSIDIFREFFKPYYKELIEHSHSLGMHFWLHACGNILPFIPELIEIGLDVLHPIQKYTMDERDVARQYGEDLCIWAGFDVQRTIPFGTPEEVRREVRFMIDTYYRRDGRLILTCGNSLTANTPLESLIALLDEALNYGTSVSRAANGA